MKRWIFNLNRTLIDNVLKDGIYPQTVHLFHHYFKDENRYLVEFIRFAHKKGYEIKGYNHKQKEGEKIIFLSFDDNYEVWYDLAMLLKKEGANCTFFINFAPNLMSKNLVKAYYRSLGLPDGKPIGLDRISSLIQDGFDFGNHGLLHVPFGSLQVSHVKTDLDLNRNYFQKQFNAKMTNVAFPYGSLRYFKKEWVKEISKEFGCVYAGHPLYQTKNKEQLIFRSPLYTDQSFEFNLKLQQIKNVNPKFTLGKSIIG